MKKPVILAVDDEPAVLAAVARDLRRRYGAEYNILKAGSGDAALDALRELKLAGEPVALLVVDQRMPGMSGVELIGEALQLHPDARRVLLTAYSDTDAAIRAINEVRLDHYLMKPWDPPEERLYPVLTDLLDDWRAGWQPPFDGVRVIGHRWSSDGHRIRDYLARNLIPYRWLDIEEDDEARQLVDLAGVEASGLPIVVFADGSRLERPANAEIAVRMGFRTTAESKVYDLVIVGAGPAGLAAAVYGASEGLRTLMVECEAPGGQAGLSSRIENYLGFPVGLSGNDLARRAVAQAKRFGAEILTPAQAVGLEIRDSYRVVKLHDGTEIAAQALLIATGVSYRMLDVPGADRLAGAGVFYGAAITEAFATREKDIFIVGGGNSAGQAAMYLSGLASSVTLLVRGASLASSMSSYLIAQIQETPNVHVRTSTVVTGVEGEQWLEAVRIDDSATGTSETLPAAALFIFIGTAPKTEWLSGIVECDGRGYVLCGPAVMPDGKRPRDWTALRDPFWLETGVPGIFAAGDVRHRSTKRIAAAVGEGAMAVMFIHQHLSGAVIAPRPLAVAGA